MYKRQLAGTAGYTDTGVANGPHDYDVIGVCAGGGGATTSVSVTVAGYNGEQDVVNAMLRMLPEDKRPRVEEGQTARQVLAEFNRKAFSERFGTDLSGISDSMALDQIQYTIFPNFTLWPAVASPLIYRFRPYGDDPNKSLFEIWFMLPKPDNGEFTVAKEHRLEEGELWASVEALGGYGPIVDQDIPNLITLQKGLKTIRKGLTLGNYQEVRIRHFHKTLEEYLAAD